MNESESKDPIKHVILLMLENSSFDRYLGCFQKIYPNLEGTLPLPPRANLDADGRPVSQVPTSAIQMPGDPKHEHVFVSNQLVDENSGFVRDFSRNYPSSSAFERQLIMSYYDLDSLPALHPLAKDFLICDHWFSSLPGPTWPNRFFALSGTSNGLVVMPTNIFTTRMVFEQSQPTIFSRLLEAKKEWKIYFHDLPSSLILHTQQKAEALARYFDIQQFFQDCNGPVDKFPDFAFIEPRYFGVNQNDDHPPHSVMKAQKLMAEVYNAIRGKKELWDSTLLIITYDEHGGFYDHVSPPSAIPPRYPEPNDEYDFARYGVRVPTVLISPWVKRGFSNTVFDHTSLLKYLVDKWTLESLGDRVKAANSIRPFLVELDVPREDTIPSIDVESIPVKTGDPQLEAKPSGHHLASDVVLAVIQDEAGIEIVQDVSEFSRTGKISEKWVRWRLIVAAIRITMRIVAYMKITADEKKAADRCKKLDSVRAMMDRARVKIKAG